MKTKKLSSSMLLRSLFCGVALCLTLAAQAQTNKKVAVGTRTPTETLHIDGSLRVATLPEDGEQLIFTKSDGTAADNFNQRYTANRVVMADMNGVLGLSPTPPPGFFYMPPVLLALSKHAVDNVLQGQGFTYAAVAGQPGVNGVYTVNLHTLYRNQFQSPRARSSASASLPLHQAAELDFFVTYYDKEVFEDVNLTAAGLLTYKVKRHQVNGVWQDITPTEKTFMNVIFRVK